MNPDPASGATEPMPSPQDIETHPLKFTGSGGAYFRM